MGSECIACAIKAQLRLPISQYADGGSRSTHWMRGVGSLLFRTQALGGLRLRKGCATSKETKVRLDAFPTLYQQRLGLHEPYAPRPLLSLPMQL
jgi:hypothetical protein